MSDLIAFLNARLDEDEETAALALRWWVEANAAAFVAVYTDTWQALDDYRPERALREVEAKRATLDLYVRTLALTEHPPVMEEGHPYAGKISARDYMDAKRELAVLRPIVTALAAIWRDHPAYHPERWAP